MPGRRRGNRSSRPGVSGSREIGVHSGNEGRLCAFGSDGDDDQDSLVQDASAGAHVDGFPVALRGSSRSSWAFPSSIISAGRRYVRNYVVAQDLARVDFDCLTEFWIANRADQERTAAFIASPRFRGPERGRPPIPGRDPTPLLRGGRAGALGLGIASGRAWRGSQEHVDREASQRVLRGGLPGRCPGSVAEPSPRLPASSAKRIAARSRSSGLRADRAGRGGPLCLAGGRGATRGALVAGDGGLEPGSSRSRAWRRRPTCSFAAD